MAKHPKRPRDTNQLAKLMVDILTGQVEDRALTPEEQGKDPAAVSLGRRGGLKGGKARAEKLTPEQRRNVERLRRPGKRFGKHLLAAPSARMVELANTAVFKTASGQDCGFQSHCGYHHLQ